MTEALASQPPHAYFVASLVNLPFLAWDWFHILRTEEPIAPRFNSEPPSNVPFSLYSPAAWHPTPPPPTTPENPGRTDVAPDPKCTVERSKASTRSKLALPGFGVVTNLPQHFSTQEGSALTTTTSESRAQPCSRRESHVPRTRTTKGRTVRVLLPKPIPFSMKYAS